MLHLARKGFDMDVFLGVATTATTRRAAAGKIFFIFCTRETAGNRAQVTIQDLASHNTVQLELAFTRQDGHALDALQSCQQDTPSTAS